MDKPIHSMQNLARRLLAASQNAAAAQGNEAELVSEKFRISLTRFAGAEGFASLQRRALLLASAEVPALQGVQVDPQGRLLGLGQLPANSSNSAARSEAAVAVTAHLLVLLMTFIGESLTLRLVREAWPDISLDDSF